MRKSLGICAALLALAAGIGVFAPARHGARTAETAASGSTVMPAAYTAALPQPEAASVAAPPAAPAATDLPSIEVPPHIVHVVPDDAATLPAPPTIFHELAERSLPAPAPRSRAIKAAIDPATIAGTARPGAGATLSVAGRTVRLFGVRPADSRERCAAGNGPAASCLTAAQAALAARLAGNSSVSCTLPPGQAGDPGFICHDAAGVDLGGLLVADGLALVDRGSSYQYIGAEDTARSHRSGLWRYR